MDCKAAPISSNLEGMLRAIAKSGISHVLFAFFAMGAWAYYVNSAHGVAAAFLAAMIQGSASALITALMKRSLEALSARLRSEIWRRILPWALTCSVAASLLVSYHLAAGTPNLLATIAVPLTVSTTYAIVYTQLLARA
jgi:heme exporter protein D